nr:protein r147 [Murid betaherpesvirus 2]
MIMNDTFETSVDAQTLKSSTNMAVVVDDRVGDVALIVAMFVILLILTTIGLLVAILRDEIENLYVANVLESERH